METRGNIRPGGIFVSVFDSEGDKGFVQNAKITVTRKPATARGSRQQIQGATPPEPQPPLTGFTDASGQVKFEAVPAGSYDVTCDAFGCRTEPVDVEEGCIADVCFRIPIGLEVHSHIMKEDCGPMIKCADVTAGNVVILRAEHKLTPQNQITNIDYIWTPKGDLIEREEAQNAREVHLNTENLIGRFNYAVTIRERGSASLTAANALNVLPRSAQSIGGNIGVTLRRTATNHTLDQALWVAIRNRTKAIGFSGGGYKDFIDRVLCKRDRETPESAILTRQLAELGDHVYGMGAYELLKTATEVFLLLECGVAINRTGAHDNEPIYDPREEGARLELGRPIVLGEIRDRLTDYLGQGRLPYINRILRIAFPDEERTNQVHCFGVIASKVEQPCLLELIWSYWHEESMLVQTLNAVSRRFQNIRGPGNRDPLAHLEIDPLRPLNNLLWGYVQDEQNRLTVKRRAYEYDHHYGLSLYGKALPALRTADSRSKFLEGFHNLLHRCATFFGEDSDTTVIADGFPLLNALKEVHLLLAQGAHNQFGDLPWTARVEMLIQQWLVARPEMRDFLQSRAMVPYKEEWMPQVDTMKTLQGWSDVTVTHFRDLGVYGEQLLLSIRYGDWIDINDEDSAKNWARYWRPEIQSYLHGYRAVTGVDLTNPDTVDYMMPSAHLQKRLALQQRAR